MSLEYKDWPKDIHGEPLERIIGRVKDPSGLKLPECNICGVIVVDGAHDGWCGDQARALLGWALTELREIRVAQGLPAVPEKPRSAIAELAAVSPDERRKTDTERGRARKAAAFRRLAMLEFDESVHG